jgi:hypothetical protein
MKYFYSILCMLLVAINYNNLYAADKPIQVRYHKTIETVMILRAISDEDPLLKQVKPDSKGRPLLYAARQHFAPYKEHPAVKATQEILVKTRDIGGILFQGVLYAEELPNAGFAYEPQYAFWKEHKQDLEAYTKVLQQFYKDAKVEQFFAMYSPYYDGAVAEATSYMNNKAPGAMEGYFGKSFDTYNLYILPLSPYGWGFSATTGKVLHTIVSPVGNIEYKENIADYKQYGFGGAEARAHYRELVTHEFTHAFITDVLEEESNKASINNYDTLFTPELQKIMDEQGYGDWWGFVNEYIVRLCEIRIAEQLNKEDAAAMRKENISEYKFVLIPAGEVLMKEYEDHRDKYINIDAFLPIIISHLGDTSKDKINAAIRDADN